MNAYYYFHKALVTLSEDPETQCAKLGYFNVAWELKDDIISNGNAVLSTRDKQLSKRQVNLVLKVLKNVAEIPEEVVQVSNSNENHLQAMRDPCWGPLRMQAKKLLSILKAETNRVDTILAKDKAQ